VFPTPGRFQVLIILKVFKRRSNISSATCYKALYIPWQSSGSASASKLMLQATVTEHVYYTTKTAVLLLV
jgi:hypothetical protein